MRAAWLVLTVLLVAPAAGEAQIGPDRDRRERLEQQVRRQFLRQIAQRLDLTEAQQDEIRGVLQESAEARVDLRLESQAVRIDLMQAVRDEEADMSRFQDILERLDAIRSRERAIQDREEAALAEILDPRQQALFLVLRMQFNDRIQQLRRGGGGPGGMPGGVGGPMPDGASGLVGGLNLHPASGYSSTHARTHSPVRDLP